MHAGQGGRIINENYLAMSTGCHFTCQRLAGPAPALAAWLWGPHSNCARTETLFSSTARGLRPSPSVQPPLSASPPPSTQGPALSFSKTQHRADYIRVIRKSTFPGLFKPRIFIDKPSRCCQDVAKMPESLLPQPVLAFRHRALIDANSRCSRDKLPLEGPRPFGARQPLV